MQHNLDSALKIIASFRSIDVIKRDFDVSNLGRESIESELQAAINMFLLVCCHSYVSIQYLHVHC
jgi:hypothetical protein